MLTLPPNGMWTFSRPSARHPRTPKASLSRPSSLTPWILSAAFLLWMGMESPSALAMSGTHGTAVSTWDTRASSVVGAYDVQSLPGGTLQTFTYNTNFSSTSSNLSSQFGIHYTTYEETDFGTLYGLSFGAVTMYGRPILPRFANGMAPLSWNVYGGLVPVALIGVTHNYLSVPLVAGGGLTIAPFPMLSITTWVEAAPNFSFDTVINPVSINADDISGTIDENGQISLTTEDVQNMLGDSVTIEAIFATAVRGGVTVAIHLGNRIDLNLRGTLGTQNVQQNALVLGGGASLTFHWDRVVPAVIPSRAQPADVSTN